MTLVLEYSLLFPWPQEAHLRHFLISSSPFSVNIYWALSLYQTPRSSRVTTEKRNQGRNRLLNWREFSLQSSMPLWPNCSYGTYISLYGAVISSCVVFPMWLLVLPRQRTTAYLFYIPIIQYRGQQTLVCGPNVASCLFFIWLVSYKQCW